MKFPLAAKAFHVATASLPFVAARTRHNPKAGKGNNGLSDYQFPSSANFTGDYSLCFASCIDNYRDERKPGGTTHTCLIDGVGDGDEWMVNIKITPEDDFNAYMLERNMHSLNHTWLFQGFAFGNSLEAQSYGIGADADNVNNIPDTMACELHNLDVLSCVTHFQEFCGSTFDTDVFSCVEGEWQETRSVYSVLAKDGYNCPAPPDGFCPEVPFTVDENHCRGSRRKRLLELTKKDNAVTVTDTDGSNNDHRRLISEHEDGVIVRVESQDSERLKWIQAHIAEQVESFLTVEREGGDMKDGWDPLMEQYFRNVDNKNIQFECSSSDGSFHCTSSSKTQCGRDLIKGHAQFHEEIAAAIQGKDGNYIFASHEVPDSCLVTAAAP